MKIRNGFVSNSSSSSFVLVVRKDAFDKVKMKEDPLIQAILEAVMTSEVVLGHECMIYDDCSSEYWFDNIDIDGIINRAKEIAGAGKLTNLTDIPYDTEEEPEEYQEFLREIVHENVGHYSIEAVFKNVPDKVWTHNIYW